MQQQVALHTAARRYLAERHAHWVKRYSEISGSTGAYSRGHRATFPRYQVASAMLEGVERLRAEEMPTLAAARERIVAASLQAETAFTNPPGGEIEAEAMAEERAVFKRFLYDLTEDDLRQVEPLYARASFTYAPPVRTSTDGAEEVITGLPTCTLQ